MRVVVNRLAALGPKTGVGYYTTQLLRCLHEQAGPDEIDEFPRGWVRRLREACVRNRPHLEASSTAPGPGRRGLASLRTAALNCLRQAGQVVMTGYFRALCFRRRYDVYHEPNFIPLPCDRPTVTTLCDLSVLLHPEWHPADRVAHVERHF